MPAISGGDSVIGVLSTALDGLSMRQRVIADNIANVDTPGFRATSIDFESSLREAVANGRDVSLQAQATTETTPVGPDGNSVDLRKQVMAAQQTQFSYQLMTRAVSDQYSLVTMAVGGA